MVYVFLFSCWSYSFVMSYFRLAVFFFSIFIIIISLSSCYVCIDSWLFIGTVLSFFFTIKIKLKQNENSLNGLNKFLYYLNISAFAFWTHKGERWVFLGVSSNHGIGWGPAKEKKQRNKRHSHYNMCENKLKNRFRMYQINENGHTSILILQPHFDNLEIISSWTQEHHHLAPYIIKLMDSTKGKTQNRKRMRWIRCGTHSSQNVVWKVAFHICDFRFLSFLSVHCFCIVTIVDVEESAFGMNTFKVSIGFLPFRK